MKRKKAPPKSDKKMFARTAQKTKAVNLGVRTMRGGIRL